MCRSVYIDEEEFDSIGALEAKLGPLVMMDPKRLCAPFVCLCPVDMQATAAKYGYVLTFDPCDDYFTKEKT